MCGGNREPRWLILAGSPTRSSLILVANSMFAQCSRRIPPESGRIRDLRGRLAPFLLPVVGTAANSPPVSIGIGGHLAMPPLPHHRAYGSVPRRFGGLTGCGKSPERMLVAQFQYSMAARRDIIF